MRTRLIWALLLLAAVFSVHGLTCAAAEPVLAATHHAAAADGPGPVSEHPTGDDAGGHDAMAHALVVCLAVLAGGVAAAATALTVWLARRRLRAWTARVRSVARAAVDRGPPRCTTPGPDRLCVLRI